MRTPIQMALDPKVGDEWKWIKHLDSPLPTGTDRFGLPRTILEISQRTSEGDTTFYISRVDQDPVRKSKSYLQQHYTPVLPEDFIQCLPSLRLILILINSDFKNEAFELLTEIGT